MNLQRKISNLLIGSHTIIHNVDVSQHICRKRQLPFESPWLLCIQDPRYIQLVVQNSHCEKLSHSHMPDQVGWYEMRKHFDPQLIPSMTGSLQAEMKPCEKGTSFFTYGCSESLEEPKRMLHSTEVLVVLDEVVDV